MADEAHLEIIGQGGLAWNQWRLENPQIVPNLSRLNFSGNFSGIDFSEADLSGANFTGAKNLKEANLSDANLSDANLSGIDFSGAGLSGLDLTKADLSGSYLGEANLNEANLSEADFSGADLGKVRLAGVILHGAKHLKKANFRAADFRKSDLSGADLREIDFSGLDLTKVDLRGANLSDANLYKANLSNANLSNANLNRAENLDTTLLSGVNLSGADLRTVNLRGVSLRGVDLRGADLRGANLTEANLYRADLRMADVSGAYLSKTNLSEARCEQAKFSDADLTLARLLDANLNGATLTGARLWETQRAGWSIKEVICESVYWDEEGKELTAYPPGEFERLHAEKVRVLVRYPDGMDPLEVVTLPALIQHLEASRPGCKLHFESIHDAPGGAVATIIIEDAEDTSPEQIEKLRAAIQAEAEQKAQYLREALESEKESLFLKGKVQAMTEVVDKLLSKPTYYLQGGNAKMGDEYNIGQAGAAGPNAHAHDMTFNQIGGNIEKSMDLSELAAELSTLRKAMRGEATEPEHDIAISEVAKAEQAAKAKDSSKVAQSLRGAGKWALDVATKIGTSLATEAIKESIGQK